MAWDSVLLLLLFGLSAFFSGAEASLFSLTPLHQHRMATQGLPFVDHVRNLLKTPRRLLVTIIAGNEAVNISLSVVAASLCIQWFGRDGEWIAVAFLTPVMLVFTEALPKTLGVTRPLGVALVVSPLMTVLSRLLRPATWILEGLSGWMIARPAQEESGRDRILTEDDFRTLVDAGQEEGVLEQAQRDLIHKVFELGDKPVAEVMVPRVEIVSLPLSMTVTEMARRIVEVRHAKVPVYGSDADDIVGILYARDFFREFLKEDRCFRIEPLLRKPYFVPTERTAGSVLKDFQAQRIQMAIVVDEYGGVAGLVTLEDILEELLTDVYGDYGVRETLWQKVNDDTWMVSGRMPLDEFREVTGLVPEADGVETVGGFVFHLFGKLPALGEEIAWRNCRFRVERIRGARIAKIRIVRAGEGSDG